METRARTHKFETHGSVNGKRSRRRGRRFNLRNLEFGREKPREALERVSQLRETGVARQFRLSGILHTPYRERAVLKADVKFGRRERTTDKGRRHRCPDRACVGGRCQKLLAPTIEYSFEFVLVLLVQEFVKTGRNLPQDVLDSQSDSILRVDL